jgi:hypothetical protein
MSGPKSDLIAEIKDYFVSNNIRDADKILPITIITLLEFGVPRAYLIEITSEKGISVETSLYAYSILELEIILDSLKIGDWIRYIDIWTKQSCSDFTRKINH